MSKKVESVEQVKKDGVVEDVIYEVGGYKFQFVPVAPYMFSTVETHIKAELEKAKPLAPLIQRGSVTRINEADPIYQDKMAVWNRYKAIVEDTTQADIALMAGVILLDPIPPQNEWLPDIEKQLGRAGIKLEDVLLPFSYMPEDLQMEFLYKKYKVFDSDLAIILFTTFFNKASEETMTLLETAVNMFRSNQG